MQLASLHSIKTALRNRYAWPGGYPLYLVMADCESMSIDAAKKNWKEIVYAHLHDDWRSSWAVMGVDINWEDDNLYCVDSGEKIESAYGE